MIRFRTLVLSLLLVTPATFASTDSVMNGPLSAFADSVMNGPAPALHLTDGDSVVFSDTKSGSDAGHELAVS